MERTAQREQKEEIEDVIEAALQQLRSNEGLYNRLLFFVHDLEKYGDSEEVRARFENSTAKFFLSECYFTDEEAEALQRFPTRDRQTFEAQLQPVFESGEPVCTSHTLAPLFWETFRINKNFAASGEFKAKYKEFARNARKKRKHRK